MKYCVIIAIGLFSINAFSESPKEESKEKALVISQKGQEARIILPKGVTLDQGDVVYLKNTPEAVDSTVKEPEPAIQYRDEIYLRRHSFRFSFSAESNKVEDVEVSSSSLLIGYSFNAGYIEPFINYMNSSSEVNKMESNSSGIGAGLEINLINNQQYNDLIPYLSAGAAYISGDNNDLDIESGGITLGLGLKAFVTQSVAIKMGYYSSNYSYSYENDKNLKTVVKQRLSQLIAGFSLYF